MVSGVSFLFYLFFSLGTSLPLLLRFAGWAGVKCDDTGLIALSFLVCDWMSSFSSILYVLL